RAGRGRDIRGVDVGGTRPRAHAHARIAVARRQARAPITEAAVEPSEDAAEIAAHVGGIAVAVDLAPGADALRPEREGGSLCRRRERRRPDRKGGPPCRARDGGGGAAGPHAPRVGPPLPSAAMAPVPPA